MARTTIRVYGLLLKDGHVLVADEIVRGQWITKFPGGGMEQGEGTKDALVREIREELGLTALELRHFYTTDFHQRSAFHDEEVQVLAIYYTFRVDDPGAIPVRQRPFDFPEARESAEVFRWLELRTAAVEAVSLPIDRVVLRMLLDGVR